MGRGKGTGVTPPRVRELVTDAVAKESQYAVAKKTGLALSLIQGLLKGDREPTTSTLQKLSDYFGVSVLELRGEAHAYWWDKLKGSMSEDDKKLIMEIVFACSDSNGGEVRLDCIKTILAIDDPSRLLKAQKKLHEIYDEYVEPAPRQNLNLKEHLKQVADKMNLKK